MREHSETVDTTVDSSQSDDAMDDARLSWEQDVAMQTYLFRIQLLSAFLYGKRCDENTQNVRAKNHTDSTQAEDQSLESDVTEHRLRSSAHYPRTRLNRAEATRRARHREEG